MKRFFKRFAIWLVVPGGFFALLTGLALTSLTIDLRNSSAGGRRVEAQGGESLANGGLQSGNRPLADVGSISVDSIVDTAALALAEDDYATSTLYFDRGWVAEHTSGPIVVDEALSSTSPTLVAGLNARYRALKERVLHYDAALLSLSPEGRLEQEKLIWGEFDSLADDLARFELAPGINNPANRGKMLQRTRATDMLGPFAGVMREDRFRLMAHAGMPRDLIYLASMTSTRSDKVRYLRRAGAQGKLRLTLLEYDAALSSIFTIRSSKGFQWPWEIEYL